MRSVVAFGLIQFVCGLRMLVVGAAVGCSASPGSSGHLDSDSGEVVLRVTAPVEGSVAVRLAAVIRNRTQRDLHFVTGGPADFIIEDHKGRAVWRALAGAAMGNSASERVLKPGDSLQMMQVWEQTDQQGQLVPRGNYRIWGVFPFAGNRAPLRVGPAEFVLP